MKTPIVDFVQRYCNLDGVRFHMPGHKGVPFLGMEALDLTEVHGADDLYHANGIILESEQHAAALFGSRHTFYATGGSSQCIGAMLYLAMQGKGRRIVAARNVHKAFLHACALLDLEVSWLYPEVPGGLCACPITPVQLERELTGQEEAPFAVYVTSPDYLGGMLDIAGLAAVCVRHGVPLLVDNAHGAYLKFLQPSVHPLDLGASMCCDSAHKTLPVLTGGAYLHVAETAETGYEARAREALSLFGSTSPSYLVLQSLDLCNAYLADGYPEKLAKCIRTVADCMAELSGMGIVLRPSEPLKMVLDAAAMGYSGEQLAGFMRDYGLECEFADLQVVVLMVTPETGEEDFARLIRVLAVLKRKEPLQTKTDSLPAGQRVCSIREAMFARHERVAVADAVGRICASPAVSCPPAVPIAVCGERITAAMANLFLRYGIKIVEVILDWQNG